ncbi:pilus assembly protein [Microbulbifer sp. 2205BS26-8]|uniref:pilus assembly PilX family protein n=1 Tax=Microbulbifer sp. 2205BS26-8 TaxID=3064386 RepID=UPI00273D0B8F|nr:pilus assembly protein [Microbulbifer sp. 2205BS26-8]MDP5208468.1 pilus assembly protein [Microbulbifer sp. 2205BS26-8]
MQQTSTFSMLHPQRGATLLVGLVILLLMTFIGLAAMRGSGMQELMAGNMRDRQLAFQAAEAALREAENRVLNTFNTMTFNGNTAGQVEDMAGATNSGFWLEYTWEGASISTNLKPQGVAKRPVYVIERVTTQLVNSGADGSGVDQESRNKIPSTPTYRITSRGVGGTENAVVILQSTFRP